MSNPTDNDVSPEEPFLSNQTLTVIGALGSILLFAFVLWLAYLPNRPDDPLAQTAEQRLQIRMESESAWASKVDTLEVVDAEKGVYKVPLKDAMELTVKAYQAKTP